MVTLATPPAALRVANPAAPVPPPPMKVTKGAVVYPAPALVMLTPTTLVFVRGREILKVPGTVMSMVWSPAVVLACSMAERRVTAPLVGLRRSRVLVTAIAGTQRSSSASMLRRARCGRTEDLRVLRGVAVLLKWLFI